MFGLVTEYYVGEGADLDAASATPVRSGTNEPFVPWRIPLLGRSFDCPVSPFASC